MVRATGSSSPSRVLSSRSPAVAIKLAGTNASVDEQGVSNIAAHALLLRSVLLTIGDYLTVLTIAAGLPLLCWRILSFGALASEARRKPVSEQHLHVLACLASALRTTLRELLSAGAGTAPLRLKLVSRSKPVYPVHPKDRSIFGRLQKTFSAVFCVRNQSV